MNRERELRRMRSETNFRWWFGMRWWLPLVLALVVALTVGAVAKTFLERFEDDFRSRAQELTAGYAFDAAIRVAEAERRNEKLGEAVGEFSSAPLFVFDGRGRLLTPAHSQGVAFSSIPRRERALAAALEGRRFMATIDDRATVVGLPLYGDRARAIVGYTRHPDLVTGLGVARDKILEAALFALFVGAVAGCLVAWLIARRLRRIARCASEIERGQFEQELRPDFPDELGALAGTIDRMRQRLRDSFATLESERDRLRVLLERLHEGVVTIDRNLVVEFANQAARRVFMPGRVEQGGALVDPWSGFSLTRFASALFRPDARVAEARVSPDEDRTYAIVGIPAADDADTAILVVQDVSTQERRERAEREFVANAAHELRTPLATIVGAVEVLQAGAKEIPDERDRFLAHIERDASRLSRLAHSLLVLARAQTREEPLRLAPVPLRPLLEAVASAVRPAPSVDVQVSCQLGLQALADHDLLEQALFNLAANAAKSTEQGRIVLAAERRNGSVALAVTDTGPGISTEEQERVFDRFYGSRRNGDGFGLGLPLVREIARALGGAVQLESSPGVGTTVRLMLPPAEGGAS